MKNTKKVLSMLLCMVFVMSTSAFAAETAVITECKRICPETSEK